MGVIKDSYNEDPVSKLSDRIRHLYDICLILRHDEYRSFVSGKEFNPLCDLCIEDERAGLFLSAEYFDKALIEAPLFSQFNDWRASINATYTGIFSDLVYGDLPTMDEIEKAFDFIKGHLK